MTTSVGSGALCTSPKGETTLFHSDGINKSNIIVPMKISWDEVEFPESWHFSNVVPAIEQRSERIEQIVQYPDGVEILFSPIPFVILVTLEFQVMNQLDLQAHLSQ